MGRSIRTFTVLPHLPERLQALQKLAYNLWWCWNHEAVALFRRIDDDLFETLEHSPVKLLGAIDQARLEQLLHDDGFLAHMDRVEEAFDNYMNAPTWFQETYGRASRNGTPACRRLPHRLFLAPSSAFTRACRLFRRPRRPGRRPSQERQRPRPAAGRRRPDVPRRLLPPVPQRRRLAAGTLSRKRLLQPAADPRDQAGRHAAARQRAVARPRGAGAASGASRSAACRCTCSTPTSRRTSPRPQITARLYGGDHDMRIRQEMVLGIGGIRALRALGKTPTVCHMNEGHSRVLRPGAHPRA